MKYPNILSNEGLWYEWLERFGKEVRDKRDISDTLKKGTITGGVKGHHR